MPILRSKRVRDALRPRITCDDMLTIREALRAGAGVGMLPAHLAEGDLASGRLVVVLPDWFEQTGTLWVVHPNRKHVPSKVSAFRDMLVEHFQRKPSRW